MLVFPVAALLIILTVLRRSLDWREAILAAMVYWGASVVLISETLSALRLIDRWPVAISWLVICVAGGFWLVVVERRRSPRTVKSTDLSELIPAAREGATKILLGGAGVIVLLVGVTALLSPPNARDTMTYHLPRVVMWISNHSVRFFPTPDYRQLIFAPWAEFAMMHTYLLSGGDQLVNTVQFFSFLGSAIAVSVIAKMLGAGPRGQLLAGIACITIPERVSEASGSLNGYVVAFWVATTAVFMMRWNEESSRFNTVCVGLAAALALLTKGTAYAFLPFVVLACWWMGSRAARIRFLRMGVVFILLIVAINGPQYFRCYELTGSPLGLPASDNVVQQSVNLAIHPITVQGTLANVLRNVALQVGTPSESVNSHIERVFRLAIRRLGVNPDDHSAIYSFGGSSFRVPRPTPSEMHATNPLHLALFLVCAGFIFRNGPKGMWRRAFWLCGGLILSFLFFCAMLKWQEWGSRLILPLFVLGSALIGFVLEQNFSRKSATAVCSVLLIVASLFSAMNRTRSLVPWNRVADVYHPRSALYFSEQPEIAPTYVAVAQAVNQSGCGDVAIDSYMDDLQVTHPMQSFVVYPLLALIHADGRTRTVSYTGVRNPSSRYRDQVPHPAPCMVVCLECANIPEKWNDYRGLGDGASVFNSIVTFR